jgi:hypothetical protein
MKKKSMGKVRSNPKKTFTHYQLVQWWPYYARGPTPARHHLISGTRKYSTLQHLFA